MPELPLARHMAACALLALGMAALLGAGLAHGGAVRDDPARIVPAVETPERLALALPASSALALARRHLGTNPTGQRSLWCADFVNLVERRIGRRGTGSRLARSFLRYGAAVSLSRALPGDIVVLSRGRRGGHVGYFKRFDARGNPVLISGNSGPRPRAVRVSTYPRGRVLGVRRPR